MTDFWNGPPPPTLSLRELRAYIRPGKRKLVAPPPEERPQKSRFEQRFHMSPEDFLKKAKQEDFWNKKGEEALELAEKGQLHEDDLFDLVEAYEKGVDKPAKQKRVTLFKPPQKGLDDWWKHLDITSAAETSKEPAPHHQTGTSPGGAESELASLVRQLRREAGDPES